MKLIEGAKLALLDELPFISQLHQCQCLDKLSDTVYRFPSGQGANV